VVKIYISREKSGTTVLFMISARTTLTRFNNEQLRFGGKIERELNERNYEFSTFKINSCYTVLTHGHLFFLNGR
jgi:hypothetical protein